MDTSKAPEVFDTHREHTVLQAWLPWVILCVVVFTWGTETFKKVVDALYLPQYHVPGLDKLVQKMPPAVPKPTLEAAVFKFNILSDDRHRNPGRGDHRRHHHRLQSAAARPRLPAHPCG